MAIVIFHTYREEGQFRTWLRAELQAGRLRQGWGRAGMTLLNEQGDLIPQGVWEENYTTAVPEWGEPGRRYEILIRMLELGEGDVVIAPNMPNDGQFTVVCVSGPYRFETPDGIDDFGHIIPVDPANIATFDNEQNEDAITISRQRGYRDAVNIVRNGGIEARLNAALAGLGFKCPA